MKAAPRLALLLLAGLSLTGCASHQSAEKPKSASAASTDDKSESGSDHWMQRNINDKFDRERGQP
ncbi:MAG TPA: hypothetical protein VF388_03540 [Lacunisphaera sp.]